VRLRNLGAEVDVLCGTRILKSHKEHQMLP
jgi:hypothetical protein